MMLAKARMINYDRQSDAPNCSVTYDHHYDDRNSFIIQANVITIVNYDRHLFIVQATGANVLKLFTSIIFEFS